jgi:predicted HTH domain antitoxin
MSRIQLTLELPEFLVDTIDIDKNKLEEYVRHTLAVDLYREGKLSLGKAKELAGFSNKWEMIRLLDSRGVSIRYTADDAHEDLDTLKQFFP